MMVKANLMLVVVFMLWTGSLTLATPREQPNVIRKFWENPVCDKYDLPDNASWIPRTGCEENRRFKCPVGYQSRVQTTCNNGKWYSELSCKSKNCFKFSNDTVVSAKFSRTQLRTISRKEECDESCANNAKCTANSFVTVCAIYENPVIFASLSTTQCFEKCNKMSECVTMSRYTLPGGKEMCTLYNVFLNEIPNIWKSANTKPEQQNAEKLYC